MIGLMNSTPKRKTLIKIRIDNKILLKMFKEIFII